MRTLSQRKQDVPVEVSKTSPAGDSRSHQGSLRSKLVLSLAAIFLMFLLIDEVVRRRVIEPGFIALERAGAIRDANRVTAALNTEVDHLRELAIHSAPQFRDYEPTSGVNLDIAASEAPTSRAPEWIGFVSSAGVWNWIQPPGRVSLLEITAAERDLHALVRSCRQSQKPVTSGISRIRGGPLAMFAVIALDAASSPAHEPPGRFLVFARQLDDDSLAALCRRTQVEFSLEPPRSSDAERETVIWQVNQSVLRAEVPLSDIDGEMLATLSIRVPRDITARSNQTIKLARNSFIFGSIAALLMLLVMLQKIVIGPLAAIREHSNRVAEEGFSTEPLLLTRNDEIGQLASAFDKMVRKLRNAQNKLAQASQAAGRSQVASTVIHNVGNVLTNVNSLLDAASAGVEDLRIGPLDKLAHRLRTDRENEGLLSATPDYLEGLAGSLKSDQSSILELLSTLHDNVLHIHDVIRDQQRYTDPCVKPSRTCLKEIVEEAIACCRARLDDDLVSVEILASLSAHVQSDRSLLLQTMINVIGNARHAMRDNQDRARLLTIDVAYSESAVRVLFCDNGCGMTHDTLQRVFDAHFTTRESGTGLGLHFCAITLKRLGGSIRAFSEGPGLGSTFVIELPLDPSPSQPQKPTTANVYSFAATNSCAPTS